MLTIDISVHTIQQRWTGTHFERCTLTDLGKRIQLGHDRDHKPCARKVAGPPRFVVVDANGYHFVNIDYCTCTNPPIPYYIQVLRAGWYPASVIRPQTAFSFEFLATFHHLTLQGKLTLYDYYFSIIRMTDNLGLRVGIVSSTRHNPGFY